MVVNPTEVANHQAFEEDSSDEDEDKSEEDVRAFAETVSSDKENEIEHEEVVVASMTHTTRSGRNIRQRSHMDYICIINRYFRTLCGSG